MPAAEHDINIEQGARFYRVVTWYDADGDAVDLTGYSAAFHVRGRKSDAAALLEATSSGGEITMGGAAGTITIDIPATTTDDLDFRRGFYDLEVWPDATPANVTRLLEGSCYLSKEVTRVT